MTSGLREVQYTLESGEFLRFEIQAKQRVTHRAKFVRKPTTMRRKAAKHY